MADNAHPPAGRECASGDEQGGAGFLQSWNCGSCRRFHSLISSWHKAHRELSNAFWFGETELELGSCCPPWAILGHEASLLYCVRSNFRSTSTCALAPIQTTGERRKRDLPACALRRMRKECGEAWADSHTWWNYTETHGSRFCCPNARLARSSSWGPCMRRGRWTARWSCGSTSSGRHISGTSRRSEDNRWLYVYCMWYNKAFSRLCAD